MLAEIVAVDGDVTPVTQALTFAVAGGVFTVITLVLTNRSKASTEERANALHERDEATRLAEKQADLAAAIAKETRDYARQDAVQARQDEVAAKTLSKPREVEDLGKVTHALVNSDKTASLRERHDTLMTTLVLMQEVIALKTASGSPPTPEALDMVANLRTRIATLEHTIDDRVRQQEAAEDAVAEEQAARPTP